jgi:hypothetical protein
MHPLAAFGSSMICHLELITHAEPDNSVLPEL